MGVWVGGARSQRVGVGNNWVMEITVGIYRGAGENTKVKRTGGFVRFVRKG